MVISGDVRSGAKTGPRSYGAAGRRMAQTTVAALAASAVLIGGLATKPAFAQLAPDAPSVQTPFGRAPLSFADVIEKVKPSVVSISVVAGGKGEAPGPHPRHAGLRQPDDPGEHLVRDAEARGGAQHGLGDNRSFCDGSTRGKRTLHGRHFYRNNIPDLLLQRKRATCAPPGPAVEIQRGSARPDGPSAVVGSMVRACSASTSEKTLA